MLLKLTITQPGLTLTINGKVYRTPTEVSVPITTVNNVVNYLQMEGVSKYKIEAIPPDVVQHKPQQPMKQAEYESDKSNASKDDIMQLMKKMLGLEQIINKIAEQDPTIIQNVISDSHGEVVVKKKDNEKTFIPQIDNSLEMKTSSSKTKKKERDSASEADALANLLKKEK